MLRKIAIAIGLYLALGTWIVFFWNSIIVNKEGDGIAHRETVLTVLLPYERLSMCGKNSGYGSGWSCESAQIFPADPDGESYAGYDTKYESGYYDKEKDRRPLYRIKRHGWKWDDVELIEVPPLEMSPLVFILLWGNELVLFFLGLILLVLGFRDDKKKDDEPSPAPS